MMTSQQPDNEACCPYSKLERKVGGYCLPCRKLANRSFLITP
uniref:Uncharacterized protein n=1 Tax=Anguilla anguilla TaxID=7936 RepID=A0A0E9V6Q6_ANGAN